MNGKYQPTKTPVCQDCFEWLEYRAVNDGNGRHSPGYIGPGRDPDHHLLDIDHVEAMDWWNRQIQDDD